MHAFANVNMFLKPTGREMILASCHGQRTTIDACPSIHASTTHVFKQAAACYTLHRWIETIILLCSLATTYTEGSMSCSQTLLTIQLLTAIDQTAKIAIYRCNTMIQIAMTTATWTTRALAKLQSRLRTKEAGE